jgi:arsenite/tail-anchored protein-transporting ATPase
LAATTTTTGELAFTRFSFFAGKGGVGKTTCAVARARELAAAGTRTLVVSTDPAHSLGDALGIALGAAPRRVAARLDAVELDADRALAGWVGARRATLREIVARGTFLDDDDVDRFMDLSLPGVDELVGLVELSRLARAGAYQAVVADTAPTGHTLRLLAMPAMLARVAEVLDDMQAKHRVIGEALGGRHRADRADQLIDDVAAEAAELGVLLRERARFSWVTLPEELAVRETEDALAALARERLVVDEIVVNKLTPAGPPCTLCDPRRAEEARCVDELRALAAGRPLRLIDFRETGEQETGNREQGTAGRPKRTLRGSPFSASGFLFTSSSVSLDVAASVRLLFFGGKGGTGKTTLAAATALAVARAHPERRVLVLSTDPAHSLGDALGCALGDDERAVPGAPPNLRARELDADHAFAARRDRYRDAVDELFDRLRGSSRFDAAFDRKILQDLIDLAPPGIDELFAVLTVMDALDARAHDLVVIDTAPTGHALRLLAMPAAAQEWVRALMQLLLKYRDVAGLGRVAGDLVDLARGLRGLTATLADGERARFVAVTRAAALDRAETARLARALDRLHVRLSAIVVNAVTGGECARCVRAATVEAAELAALGAAVKDRAILTAPAVAPPPRGASALAAFAARLRLARAASGRLEQVA